jgi:hypothetical protein
MMRREDAASAIVAIVAIVAIAAAPSSARAADGRPCAEPRRHEWRRALNDHIFIPSLIVPDPFVPTAFSLLTGGGIADARTPPPELAGYRFGDGRYRLASLAATIGFSAGITRWLGVRLFGVAAGFGAVGMDAAAAVGGTLFYDALFGLTVSGPLGRRVRLGLVVDADWGQARSVVPRDLLDGGLRAARVQDLTIDTITRTSIGVLPGLSVAVAPHAALGLVGTVQAGWERTEDDRTRARTDGGTVVVATVVDLDLRALTRALPIGFVAAYRARLPFASDERPSHDAEAGIYYTGRDALAVGLTARARWFELRPGVDATALGGAVILRFFFR